MIKWLPKILFTIALIAVLAANIVWLYPVLTAPLNRQVVYNDIYAHFVPYATDRYGNKVTDPEVILAGDVTLPSGTYLYPDNISYTDDYDNYHPGYPFGRFLDYGNSVTWIDDGLGEDILDGNGLEQHVIDAFSFVDLSGREWFVPVGAIVDGASIPDALQPLLGDRNLRAFRLPSAIHDLYCDIKTRRYSEVHRVFYDTLRETGVSEARAKILWAGVRYFGPRWKILNTSGQCLGDCDGLPPIAAKYNSKWFVGYMTWLAENPGLEIDTLESFAKFCDAAAIGKITIEARNAFKGETKDGRRVPVEELVKVGCPLGNLGQTMDNLKASII